MAKKRKTKQEKIILQLKRQLARQEARPTPRETRQGSQKTTLQKPRQEAISKAKPEVIIPKKVSKKLDSSVFSYSPRLIRMDLIKSLVLALIIISSQIVLYLKLR